MSLDRAQMLQAYRTMAEIREFELRLHRENKTGDVPGFLHLYAGQEAIAVGVGLNLTDRDSLGSTHRGHGHAIAKGCDIPALLAEIFGKRSGLCAGKGGSMHVADLPRGLLGANAIVGGAPSLCIGAALTAKVRGKGAVAIAFGGDGSSNQGTTFEAMNMAVVLQLPCVFVMENNGYGEGTGCDYAVGSRDVAARAAAFGMPAVKVDGTDVFAVHEAANKLIEAARRGGGPATLEAFATRIFGHFEGDPMLYRSTDELRAARAERDPLQVFRKKTAGRIDAADLDRIDCEARDLMEEAVKAARAAPQPDAATDLLTDVYVTY